jgi:hypothetical protein
MTTATLPTPKELTPQLRSRFIGALEAVFIKESDLEDLVAKHLGMMESTLEEIVGVTRGERPGDIARRLVIALSSQNKIPDLAQAMLEMRPDNLTFRELAKEFGVTLADPVAGAFHAKEPNLALIRDRVTRFNERLKSRQRQFGYLHAYKQLHDSVHDLQDKLVAVRLAIEEVRRQPTDRRNLRRVAIQLLPLVSKAKQGAASAEFEEDYNPWVNEFAEVIQVLRADPDGADIAPLDDALDKLFALPNRLEGVNRELIQTAKRLEPEFLVPMMDDILGELLHDSHPDNTREEVRAKLLGFRALCDSLNRLQHEHNICQRLDTALGVARQAPSPFEARAYQQANVLKNLLEILAGRPGDELAEAAVAAAREVEANAGAAKRQAAEEQFDLLTESCRHLFSQTDKDLLEVTGKLVNEALILDALLGRFTDVRDR